VNVGRSKGFSVLEVLIAFGVMTTVLAILLPANLDLLRRDGVAQDRLMALDYAHSRLDELGIARPLASGEFEESLGGWTIIERQSLQEAAEGALRYIHIAIEINDESGRQLAAVSSVRLAE
jgi:type II secretory pathway pseudopilin PulG